MLKYFRIYTIMEAETLEEAYQDFEENKQDCSFNVEEIETVE